MSAPENCKDCLIGEGAHERCEHTIEMIGAQTGNIPGPECPLALLDAANAENEILRQRNLSDPLIQATTKHLQAEIEQLHESLAAKERECEGLREAMRVSLYDGSGEAISAALSEGGERERPPQEVAKCVPVGVGNKYPVCSVCYAEIAVDHDYLEPNYCPYCGARIASVTAATMG